MKGGQNIERRTKYHKAGKKYGDLWPSTGQEDEILKGGRNIRMRTKAGDLYGDLWLTARQEDEILKGGQSIERRTTIARKATNIRDFERRTTQ